MTICERMAQRAVDEAIERQSSGMHAGLPVAKMDASQLQHLIKERQWQPIETAPKDGRHVIGWFGDSEIMPYAEQVYFDAKAGTWSWSQDGDTSSRPPTHWMPLPEPPK